MLRHEYQVPASVNNDGNLDADEYLFVDLGELSGETCPEDLNGDNLIDLADLGVLLAHYGATAGVDPADGDIDADGNVDLGDLGALLALYGGPCP